MGLTASRRHQVMENVALDKVVRLGLVRLEWVLS